MRRPFDRILQVALVALVAAPGAFAAKSLDEQTGGAAILQNPDNVLAALVEVQSKCRAKDTVCLDGVRVVQVLLHRHESGASVKPGDWFTLNLGPGNAENLPSIGDRVLFVGPAFVEKNGTKGFSANAMTVSPSEKDIEDLRLVVASVQTKPGA